MNIILIDNPLHEQSYEALQTEFSNYDIIALQDDQIYDLQPEVWDKVEIIYGSRLTKRQLDMARQLRWVHSSTSYTHDICMRALLEKETIMVTITRGLHGEQMAEFAMAGILSFAKNLSVWKEANSNIDTLWDKPERNTMWSLRNKSMAIIGMGSLGSEVARLAKYFGISPIGFDIESHFHAHCHKVLPYSHIKTVLPHTDIVCITLPHGEKHKCHFSDKEFNHMKNDSILIVLSAS